MAAGLGFKTFATGDVLTATDTNGYLMQGVWVFADATARNAAVTSPQEGNTCYLKDTDVIEVYDGSAWVVKSAPVPGASTWSLLNAGGTLLTGAQTVTVSGISGKSKLFILVDEASSANVSADISIRLNADTGANYAYFGLLYIGAAVPDASSANFLDIMGGTSYVLGRMSNNAGSTVTAQALIDGCDNTGLKIIQSSAGSANATGSGQRITALGGYYSGSSAITSVSIFSSTGNLDAGRVYVYGV